MGLGNDRPSALGRMGGGGAEDRYGHSYAAPQRTDAGQWKKIEDATRGDAYVKARRMDAAEEKIPESVQQRCEYRPDVIAQLRLCGGDRMQTIGLERAIVRRDRLQQERQERGLLLL
jgi:hypothetical protein